ncbi:MAG: SDR family oxidoreductase [Candidatus Eisenbacteria bacterium]|uniref:SDR family oxidoreductase n=1 Tax=Eiseniibacteriota bacterium TaxID=2212470 RepID=A0A948S0I4_UNCEI|nr:SDR family oxidoreductase [Candidatus Eisenbacteria bacterium]MBU1947205.1 SDR family oxidoreductase [Candidatus Eisenbacteria bacterium]MBU2693346.1 SDR family oxidoreductase [Candidatus Eisenbacteria bacterium]
MNLKGSRALVTGGSEGIGRGIAEALIRKGARVAIMSRNKEKVEKVAGEIGALPIQGNVGIEADAVRAVETVVREFGGIDLLVNNAGFGQFFSLVEADVSRFEDVFRTNVTGAMLMAREAAKHFIAEESGHLVNISSTSGLRGGRGSTAYAGSKFALRGMTECWRDELRPHNVRVTLVNPSEVQTGFFKKVGREQEESLKKLRPSEIADAIVGALEIDDRGFIPEFSVFATNPF